MPMDFSLFTLTKLHDPPCGTAWIQANSPPVDQSSTGDCGRANVVGCVRDGQTRLFADARRLPQVTILFCYRVCGVRGRPWDRDLGKPYQRARSNRHLAALDRNGFCLDEFDVGMKNGV